MKELAIKIWSYSEEKWILPIPTVAGEPPILFSFSADTKHPITYIGFNKNFLGFEDYEIVRYTGLRDKNGIKIFEGDIIKSKNDNACGEIIYWSNGFYCSNDGTGAYDFTGRDDIEVIGNVYENPELIKNS